MFRPRTFVRVREPVPCIRIEANVGRLRLERLVLSSNQFETVNERSENRQCLDHLKHLSLTSNRINDMRDIARLTQWCPELQSLTLAGNPLVLGPYVLP